ncbi:MAG: FGGY-family carbohydrate kinase [Alphaproteobacteria bacterium]
MTLFLGIDAGNTGVKAVLFDSNGVELARSVRETGSSSPGPGMVERDINRLRSDLVDLIIEILDKSGKSGKDIGGIGTSGHGNGLYLINKDHEQVIAIQSMDTRASGIAADWHNDGTADAAFKIAYQRPWASQTPTLLSWMKYNKPELVDSSVHLLMCKDVITLALTDEIVGDVTDMGGAGLLSLPENSYSDDLLEVYGLRKYSNLLPKLLWPTDIAGVVTDDFAARTGLSAGTPVVAGFFDVISSAVGAGVTKLGQTSVIIGTWSINQAIVDKPAAGVFMSCGILPGLFMAMDNSATSATNLEWVAHHLMGGSKDAFIDADRISFEASLTPSSPLYHPYLYGAAGDSNARAGIFGLAGWHSAGDLMRAVFEGVAFAHVQHIETLRSADIPTEGIILSGGGSRSPVWPQMLADMLGKSVSVSSQPEAGALGAAMAAAVGTGFYQSLDEAVTSMTKAPRLVRPAISNYALYEKRYKLWRAVQNSLTTHWETLMELRGE